LLVPAVLAWVPEPRRSVARVEVEQQGLAIGESIRTLWADVPMRRMILSGVFSSISVYGTLAWMPTFFQRSYGWSTATAGVALGVGIGIGGVIGILVSGVVGDRMRGRDPGAHGLVYAVLTLCGTGLGLLGFLSPWAVLSLVALTVLKVLSQSGGPCQMACIQGIVDARSRAMVTAVMSLTGNLIGFGFGPPVIGFVSDRLSGGFGSESLRYALLLTVAANALATFYGFAAVRSIRRSAAG
jgi:MFS family permease